MSAIELLKMYLLLTEEQQNYVLECMEQMREENETKKEPNRWGS